MIRLGVALVVAFSLLWASGSVARAGEEFCSADPLVLIQTSGGRIVPVFVTTSARGAEHLPAVLAAEIRYAVQTTEDGRATRVKMEVFVADDQFGEHFDTRTVASSSPLATGAVHANAVGHSGRVMRMTFTLSVP